MADLLELGFGHSPRVINSLEDRSGHLVRHLALVAVGPEFAAVEVVFPEGHRDVLPPHVAPGVPTRQAPPCPDRPVSRLAGVLPLPSLSSAYETGPSLLGRLLFEGLGSSFRHDKKGSHRNLAPKLGG